MKAEPWLNKLQITLSSVNFRRFNKQKLLGFADGREIDEIRRRENIIAIESSGLSSELGV